MIEEIKKCNTFKNVEEQMRLIDDDGVESGRLVMNIVKTAHKDGDCLNCNKKSKCWIAKKPIKEL